MTKDSEFDSSKADLFDDPEMRKLLNEIEARRKKPEVDTDEIMLELTEKFPFTSTSPSSEEFFDRNNVTGEPAFSQEKMKDIKKKIGEFDSSIDLIKGLKNLFLDGTSSSYSSTAVSSNQGLPKVEPKPKVESKPIVDSKPVEDLSVDSKSDEDLSVETQVKMDLEFSEESTSQENQKSSAPSDSSEDVDLSIGSLSSIKELLKTNESFDTKLQFLDEVELVDPGQVELEKLEAKLAKLDEELSKPEFDFEAELAKPRVEPTKPKVESTEPEVEPIKPEVELVKPEVELVKPEVELTKPEVELVKPEVELVKPEVELVKPEVELVKPEVELVKPEVELVKPEVELTKPEVELVKPEVELTANQLESEAKLTEIEAALAKIELELSETEKLENHVAGMGSSDKIYEEKQKALQEKLNNRLFRNKDQVKNQHLGDSSEASTVSLTNEKLTSQVEPVKVPEKAQLNESLKTQSNASLKTNNMNYRNDKKSIPRILVNILLGIVGLLLVASLVVYFFSQNPEKSFVGYNFHYVNDNSMKSEDTNFEDGFSKNSIVLTKNYNDGKFELGDIVSFKPADSEEYLIHRIVELRTLTEENVVKPVSFVTKGDANVKNDPLVDISLVQGKKAGVIHIWSIIIGLGIGIVVLGIIRFIIRKKRV